MIYCFSIFCASNSLSFSIISYQYVHLPSMLAAYNYSEILYSYSFFFLDIFFFQPLPVLKVSRRENVLMQVEVDVNLSLTSSTSKSFFLSLLQTSHIRSEMKPQQQSPQNCLGFSMSKSYADLNETTICIDRRIFTKVLFSA